MNEFTWCQWAKNLILRHKKISQTATVFITKNCFHKIISHLCDFLYVSTFEESPSEISTTFEASKTEEKRE